MTKEKIIGFLECLLLRSDVHLGEDCRQAVKDGIDILKDIKPNEKIKDIFEPIAEKYSMKLLQVMGEYEGALEEAVDKIIK